MFWLIIYRMLQWLSALLTVCAIIALPTKGIAYLIWVVAGILLFFAWKDQADEIMEEMEL